MMKGLLFDVYILELFALRSTPHILSALLCSVLGWGEESVQRSQQSSPDTTLLRKASLQGWPLAAVWEFGFQASSHYSLTDQHGSLHLQGLHRQCGLYGAPACLRGGWCLVRARQRVSMGSAPGKTLGTGSELSFPGRQNSTQAVTVLGELSMSVRLYCEGTPRNLHLASFSFCPMRFFPLLILICIFLL